ncbi:hypothetical protein ACFC09_45080 [Streptomyces sp. NPDC056161]|uniref:hypothetical protein n=1 Tax=Streptomyces sp. NPDC056161 TaxID=3345732 RepID=UPI0035D5CA88
MIKETPGDRGHHRVRGRGGAEGVSGNPQDPSEGDGAADADYGRAFAASQPVDGAAPGQFAEEAGTRGYQNLISTFPAMTVVHDTWSIGKKPEYIKSKGPLGGMIWEMSGDTPNGTLMNTLATCSSTPRPAVHRRAPFVVPDPENTATHARPTAGRRFFLSTPWASDRAGGHEHRPQPVAQPNRTCPRDHPVGHGEHEPLACSRHRGHRCPSETKKHP